MPRRHRPTLDDGPDTAVLYLRISQDRDGQRLGVERQEADCRALAARLGLDVVRLYIDNDTSATNGKVRPEFEAMISDAPEAIISWHQDRLLRLTSDLEKVIALDVPVYTVTAGTMDLSTPAGRAVARTVAAWSTYETEQKAVRQRRANVQRAARGYWQFSRRPFGYKRENGRVVQVPEEAAIVAECFRRYIAGESYYALAGDLNARGVPTFNGTAWSMERVRQMLRNPRYAGLAEYKGEPVELEEGYSITWEPIIDARTWDDYLAVREGRTRAGSWSTSTKHLLSGLAECGVCGGRMTARPDRGRQVYACGANWCTSRGGADVDAMVEAVVLSRLADPKVVQRLRTAPDLAPLDEEIRGLRKRRDDIADLVADGLIERRKARAQLTQITERLDALTKRRSALRRKSPTTDLALARSVPRRWAGLDVMAKRRVISDLGLRVLVDKMGPGRRGFDPSTVRLVWEDEAAEVA